MQAWVRSHSGWWVGPSRSALRSSTVSTEVAITLIDAVGPTVPGLFVLLRFPTTNKLLSLLIVLDTAFVTFSVLMLSLLIFGKRRAVGVGELDIVLLSELEVR